MARKNNEIMEGKIILVENTERKDRELKTGIDRD